MEDRSPAGFAARAAEVAEQEGYRALKIAPFDGLNWARASHAEATRLLGAGIDRIKASATPSARTSPTNTN